MTKPKMEKKKLLWSSIINILQEAQVRISVIKHTKIGWMLTTPYVCEGLMGLHFLLECCTDNGGLCGLPGNH